LEIDALPSGLGRHEDLGFQIPEAALREQAGAFLIPAAGLHAAVDLADCQSPTLQLADEVIERVFVFGEQAIMSTRVKRAVDAKGELPSKLGACASAPLIIWHKQKVR
jgi:hypothetical protein